VIYIIYDLHVHTGYTKDVKGNYSIEDYYRSAIKAGIRGICVTNHFEYHPERGLVPGNTIMPEQIDTLIKEFDKARESIGSNIYLGLEVTFSRRYLRDIRKVLEDYEHMFDFIIGSIHYVKSYEITESYPPLSFFRKYSEEEVYKMYFREVEEAIESQLFDVIGHPDVIRKHAVKYYGHELEPSMYIKIAERSIEMLKEYNAGIEINTSGFRHGINSFYPRDIYLETCWKYGIKYITYGSDAHDPQHVGYMWRDATEKLKDLGYRVVYYYVGRKPRELLL